MTIWNKQLQVHARLLFVFVLARFIPGAVPADTVVISGCDSLDNNSPVTITATLNASSSGTCNLQSLTKAVFKAIPTNGPPDDLCTLDISSGCNTTTQPGGCVCKKLVGDLYTFELRFTYDASKYQGGTLDLEPNCFPQGDFANRATCTNLQAVDRCSGITCKLGATCSVNSNQQPECNCNGTYHFGQRCEKNVCLGHTGSAECTVAANEYSVARYFCSSSFMEGSDCAGFTLCLKVFIIAITFLCVFLVATIAWLIYIFITPLEIKCCVCFDPKLGRIPTEDDIKTKIEGLIKKDCCCFACCCCGCCCFGCCIPYTVHVEILECGVIVVPVTTRVAMLFCSPNLSKKIEEYIEQEVLPPETPRFWPRSAPSLDNSVRQPTDPPTDYPLRSKPQPRYTGQGSSERQKKKSDKEVPLSNVRGSSPPSDTSSSDKAPMIPSTQGRALPMPSNKTTAGIGNSASQRLDPLQSHPSKMPSVERNSGAFQRDLPSPRHQPLGPIPSGKTS